MQLLPLWTIMAAVVVRHSVASVDMTCDCRLWHKRDPSINLHCTKGRNASPGVSCQKVMVSDIPRGYQFITGYGLVKLHRTFMTWRAAKRACEADGSRLAIPPDSNAVSVLHEIFAKEKLWWMYIGISDEASEGLFVGVDGRPASYLPWQTNEPSDHEGKENCVHIWYDVLYNDISCDRALPFFCERLLSVGIPDTYRWLEEAGRFYKVHTEKLGHVEAAKVCRSENATLAVPGRWRHIEALLRSVLEPNDEQYHIGFTDLEVEGDFVTETGRHLSDMEFQAWRRGEPNNNDGGKQEDCLVLSGYGYLNDVRCENMKSFICEILPE